MPGARVREVFLHLLISDRKKEIITTLNTMHSFLRFDPSILRPPPSSQLYVAGLAVKVNDLVLRVARRLRRAQLRQPARIGRRRSRGRR